MGEKKKTLKEWMEELDTAVLEEEQRLFGSYQITPEQQSIINILNENPLLVRPTLTWLQKKKAQIAAAQLLALYDLEELKSKMSDEDWALFKLQHGIKEETDET